MTLPKVQVKYLVAEHVEPSQRRYSSSSASRHPLPVPEGVDYDLPGRSTAFALILTFVLMIRFQHDDLGVVAKTVTLFSL